MTYLIIALIALIGIIGGIVSGLFGVGGGLIFVPLLILAKNFDTHTALGTSLAVVVPTAMVGCFRYAQAGKVEWQTAFLIIVFALAGAWIGSGLSLKLDVNLLRKLFAGFLVILAAKLYFQN